MSIDPTSCLMLSGILFGIGLFGVVARRNLLIVLMSIELMLAAGGLALVAFARRHGQLDGQAVALLLLGASAGRAAIGLAIVVAVHRQRGSVDSDTVSEPRG